MALTRRIRSLWSRTGAAFAAHHAEDAASDAIAGFVLAAVVLAASNAIAIALRIRLPVAGLGLRALHHAFDAIETFAAVSMAAIPVVLWLRFVPARRWMSALVYLAGASLVMFALVGSDLRRQADVALNGPLAAPILASLVVLCGLAIVGAHALGAALSSFRRLRFVPAVVAIAGIAANHILVADDYPGMHSVVAWGATVLLALSMGPLVRSLALRRGVAFARYAAVAALVLGAFGVAIAPPNAVRAELFREPWSPGPVLLSFLVWSPPHITAAAVKPASRWFESTEALPSIEPTSPRLATKPVVVMVTVDALRGDVVRDHDDMLPTIALLKREGAYFPHATSAGSQTAVSLTAMFSSKYFSQLYWSLHGSGNARFVYAADDPSPRFPALLTAGGVRTASFCSLNFLADDFGVVRGFASQKIVPKGRRHANAREMVEPLLGELRRIGDEPAFLYVHLMEPHAPYDRGPRKDGSDFEKYLSEVTVIDGELGRIRKLLDQRFRGRSLLILAADHGEAFGEHETHFHTKTLYEELLRVPLVVRGAGVARRRIEQHVGLIDIGPTILDVFGVPTPASFMGQSLVPLLRGENVVLDRPLAAEGRLRKAIYLGPLKVIEDDRRKIVEVFDIEQDPKETRNLFDFDRTRVEPAVATLRAFFAVHALRRPGYEPPYKP